MQRQNIWRMGVQMHGNLSEVEENLTTSWTELGFQYFQPLKLNRYSNPHKTAGIWGEEMSELHRMTFSEQICTTRDRLKSVAGFHSCRHVSLKTPV